MKNEHSIEFLMLIAERKYKEELCTMLTRAGGRIISTIYAKGSVKANSLMEVLGFVVEEHKVLITSLISDEKADDVLKTLIKEFHFDNPNTGIAFTIPVEGLSY